MRIKVELGALKVLTFVMIFGTVAPIAWADNYPTQYRASFVDAQTGARLDIAKNQATLTTPTAKVVSKSLTAESYDALSKAKSAAYMIDIKGDDLNIDEIYWVTPDPASKKQYGDLVVFNSDVIYYRMDTKPKQDVQEIDLLHSKSGTVMLNLSTKTWQVGWPSDREQFHLQRVVATP